MIRDIEEYKERLIKLEIYEHAKRTVNAWLSGQDTTFINKCHNEFMEKMEDDNFVMEMFIEYLNTHKQ